MTRGSRAILLACIAALLATSTVACSCAHLDRAGLLASSDVVFRARVLRKRIGIASGNYGPEPFVRADLIPDLVWKGKVGGVVTVETGFGHGDCGVGFLNDHDYLVFANRAGGRLGTSICSGTTEVLPGETVMPGTGTICHAPPPPSFLAIRRLGDRIAAIAAGFRMIQSMADVEYPYGEPSPWASWWALPCFLIVALTLATLMRLRSPERIRERVRHFIDVALLTLFVLLIIRSLPTDLVTSWMIVIPLLALASAVAATRYRIRWRPSTPAALGVTLMIGAILTFSSNLEPFGRTDLSFESGLVVITALLAALLLLPLNLAIVALAPSLLTLYAFRSTPAGHPIVEVFLYVFAQLSRETIPVLKIVFTLAATLLLAIAFTSRRLRIVLSALLLIVLLTMQVPQGFALLVSSLW